MESKSALAIERIYGGGGPFPVYSCAEFKRLYKRYGLDPRASHPWLFDQESLAHFRQAGVLALFRLLKIRPEHRVLSLGEGHGAPSRLLAKTVGCRVTGVDILPRQAATAAGLARFLGMSGRLKYEQQDVQELDLGSRRFDRLYMNETMCHWPDKVAALSRAARHLKPGALAGANDWLAGDKGGLEEAARMLPSFKPLCGRGIWRQVSLAGLQAAFEEAGFEVLSAVDLTREIDQDMRRRLSALKRFEAGLSSSDRRWVPYFSEMLKTHFRFLRYGRVVAKLGRGKA